MDGPVFSLVPSEETLYRNIRTIVLESREHIVRVVNRTMIKTYFEIGRLIYEDELHGEARAEYGKRVLVNRSKRLSEEFGRGFSRQNLQNMKQFYLSFKNCQTLFSKLSWSHYTLLMRLENEPARDFYILLTAKSSTKSRSFQLDNIQVAFQYFELN